MWSQAIDAGGEPRQKAQRFSPLKSIKGRTVVIVVIVGYLAFFSARVCFWAWHINNDLGRYQQQKQTMLQQQQALQEEVRLLHTNAYIERLAREELGLIKPGETLLLQAQQGDPQPLRPFTPAEMGD